MKSVFPLALLLLGAVCILGGLLIGWSEVSSPTPSPDHTQRVLEGLDDITKLVQAAKELMDSFATLSVAVQFEVIGLVLVGLAVRILPYRV